MLANNFNQWDSESRKLTLTKFLYVIIQFKSMIIIYFEKYKTQLEKRIDLYWARNNWEYIWIKFAGFRAFKKNAGSSIVCILYIGNLYKLEFNLFHWKPLFNQFMSVFGMKIWVFTVKIFDWVFEYFNIQSQAWMKLCILLVYRLMLLYYLNKTFI